VLLVDYPGFNLRLARRLHGGGPRIVYYVCPQVWAWHRSRIRQMARTVDRLITIFPFEPAHFEGTGLRADYAGHPLADKAAPTGPAPGEPLPWRGEPRVALLPGSRANEVDRILPRMWRAAAMLQAELPGASFIIPCPSPEMEALVRGRIAALGAPAPSKWSVVAGRSLETLRQARAAAVASGTATVEAALMGCPMIVVYRTAPLTYALGRLLVRVPHIGMVNIIAGREICPEFIQHAADPGRMCGALKDFCEDTPLREAAVSGLKEVVERLGGPGARKRAAEIVAEELNMAAQKQTMSPGRSG
jgi:lipid-A-disaccharide synthase